MNEEGDQVAQGPDISLNRALCAQIRRLESSHSRNSSGCDILRHSNTHITPGTSTGRLNWCSIPARLLQTLQSSSYNGISCQRLSPKIPWGKKIWEAWFLGSVFLGIYWIFLGSWSKVVSPPPILFLQILALTWSFFNYNCISINWSFVGSLIDRQSDQS